MAKKSKPKGSRGYWMEKTKIKIDGKEYTIEEARKLKDELDMIFGNERNVEILPYIFPTTTPQPIAPWYE